MSIPTPAPQDDPSLMRLSLLRHLSLPRSSLPHLSFGACLFVAVLVLATVDSVSAASHATRIIANGVPIEVVFVSDPSELAGDPDLDTDDYDQPIPKMGQSVCTSLDGPDCLSMIYGVDDIGADNLEMTPEETEELYAYLREHLGDDLGGLDFDFDFDFGLDGLGGGDEELYITNEELLDMGVFEMMTGYSRVYSLNVPRRMPVAVSEEYAIDMLTFAERSGLTDEFAEQYDMFWANLEDPDSEYQAFVLLLGDLTEEEVVDQVTAHLAGSIKTTDFSFTLVTFLIDFDGIKPLDLRTLPRRLRHQFVSEADFLEDVLNSLQVLEEAEAAYEAEYGFEAGDELPPQALEGAGVWTDDDPAAPPSSGLPAASAATGEAAADATDGAAAGATGGAAADDLSESRQQQQQPAQR